MKRTQWLVMEPSEGQSSAPFRTRLAGAGRHLPATHLSTSELMSRTRHRTHIDLERLTGIHERRVSVGDEDSYSLATAAAFDCLDKAGRSGSSVDVVISCSITKFHGGLTQWLEPTISRAVANAIGAQNTMTFGGDRVDVVDFDRCPFGTEPGARAGRRSRGRRAVGHEVSLRPASGSRSAPPSSPATRTR